MAWKIGVARNLEIRNTSSWDGSAAERRIFEYAGFNGDDPKPAQARRGFLFYDDDPDAQLARGRGYAVPLATPNSSGQFMVDSSAISAALSFLDRTGVPASLRSEGRQILETYRTRRDNMQNKTFDIEKFDLNTATSEDIENLFSYMWHNFSESLQGQKSTDEITEEELLGLLVAFVEENGGEILVQPAKNKNSVLPAIEDINAIFEGALIQFYEDLDEAAAQETKTAEQMIEDYLFDIQKSTRVINL